jgi:hypothetical protein
MGLRPLQRIQRFSQLSGLDEVLVVGSDTAYRVGESLVGFGFGAD